MADVGKKHLDRAHCKVEPLTAQTFRLQDLQRKLSIVISVVSEAYVFYVNTFNSDYLSLTL